MSLAHRFAGTLAALLAAALMVCAPAHAQRVEGDRAAAEGLYATEVPVRGQGEPERNAAFSRALASVLGKLTGNRSAASQPGVSKELRRAKDFVEGYDYRQDEGTSANGAPSFSTVLVVRFRHSDVDAIAGALGLAVWPEPRPKPVLWLAIDDGTGPRLVALAQANVARGVLQRAVERGYKLGLPGGSAAEQAAVGAIWRGDTAAIARLSARYSPPMQLIGKLYRDKAGWKADWTFVDGGRVLSSWKSTDTDARRAMVAGADGAADALTRRYAKRSPVGPAGVYRVTFTRVDDSQDFIRLFGALQGMSSVRGITPISASADALVVDLDLLSGLVGFRRTVDSNLLVEIGGGDTAPTGPVVAPVTFEAALMSHHPVTPPDALGDIAVFLKRLQWGVVAAVAFWLVWVMAPILTPFVVAAMLGWLGDPLVDRVERSGRSRNTGVILVFALMALLLVLALLILVPMIQRQIMTLIESLPTYRDWFINTAVPWVERRTGFELATWLDPQYIIDQLRTHWERAGGIAATALAYISRSGFALFASLANIVLIPVLTFFFLRDWDVFIAKVAQLIPRSQLPTVARLAKESSNMLGGFLRGQFTVMLILGAMYGLGLWAVGLDLGLLIGIVAGLLTFVPYLGPASGVIFGVIAALVQYGDWKHVAGVLAVFGVGQVIESYWLTPKLVGDRIGLHPVAVIFAVLAGGQLFGFLGMLLALPIAAVANVLLHYMHERYTGSRLYAGDASPLVVPAHMSSGGVIVPGEDVAAAQVDATPRHSDGA